MKSSIPSIVLALAASLNAAMAHASCGAAFCAINTNWNLQGYAPEPGLRLDVRFEFMDQDQPMAGRDKVASGQIRRHHDELRTINRNYVGTLDYTIDQDWGVALTAPIADRSHSHIHNHRGAQILDQWNFTEPGDLRVLGRYQRSFEDKEKLSLAHYGANFGLKLPTGGRDVRNAGGDRAERTLQPGTGTTDLLLGAYYSKFLPNSDSSWFIQGLWQAPLNSREEFKPGARVSIDLGYRREATEKIGLMIQLNALHRQRDRGRQAEPEDSGGQSLFLSPGLSYAVTKSMQVYGFLQKPIYQQVNGVQLTADWAAVLGISARF